MEPKQALEEAIRIAKTQTALASAIGGKVRTGHIYYWLKHGIVPAEHAPAIERFTGVRCEQLCPGVAWDILREQAAAAAAQA